MADAVDAANSENDGEGSLASFVRSLAGFGAVEPSVEGALEAVVGESEIINGKTSATFPGGQRLDEFLLFGIKVGDGDAGKARHVKLLVIRLDFMVRHFGVQLLIVSKH